MQSHKIISVEIVAGNSLVSEWKSPMQRIVTDKGTFIDNIPHLQFGRYNVASPGYDWKLLEGKEATGIKVFSSRDFQWLNKVADTPHKLTELPPALALRHDKLSSLDRALRVKLENAFLHMSENFAETLRDFILKSGMDQSEVYKRAGIDRKAHSKIFTREGYIPKKETVFAYAVALRLSLAQTNSLLESAGYAFCPNNITDVIVREFISYGNYDFYAINDTLDKYGQEILGSKLR